MKQRDKPRQPMNPAKRPSEDEQGKQKLRLGVRLAHYLYPELRLASERHGRHDLFNTAQRKLLYNPWAWVVAIPGTTLLIVPLYFGKILLLRYGLISAWLANLILALILLLYVFWVSTFVFVKPMRKYMRREMVKRGIFVCLRCGYDLRGLQQPRCPECGTPFDTRTHSADGCTAASNKP